MHFWSSFVICATLLLAAVVVSAKSVVPNTAIATSDTDGQNQIHQNFVVVKDIDDFVRNHPILKLIPLIKQRGPANIESIRYTIGGRVPGDRLLTVKSDNFHLEVPSDVNLRLTYPEKGTGKVLTHVEIVVAQSSNEGNAYVVDGGIEQRYITIVIEAKNTDYFSYYAQYYGSD